MGAASLAASYVLSMLVEELLGRCHFPPSGSPVHLAVSGGADSTALVLLAVAGRLDVHIHHVDHHLRARSAKDAALVRALAADLGVAFTLYDVDVAPGSNLEARARAARRAVLPAGTMTGHSMDDLAETVVINMLRGAALDGLSPMVGDPTKPLIDLRRGELHALVAEARRVHAADETNDDLVHLRNRVRHELLPAMSAAAARDLVPVLARQAHLIFEERQWLDELAAADRRRLEEVDCREIGQWPLARQRRFLRERLRVESPDGRHPPGADEIERALAVVRGDAVATELSGGRRLSRRGQYLSLA